MNSTSGTGDKKTKILVGIIIGGVAIMIGILSWAVTRMLIANPIFGNWVCTSLENGLKVELDLNSDGTFVYGDPYTIENNHLSGDEYEVIKGDDGKYVIKFGSTTEAVVNGEKQHSLAIYNFGDVELKNTSDLFSRKVSATLEDLASKQRMAFECKAK